MLVRLIYILHTLSAMSAIGQQRNGDEQYNSQQSGNQQYNQQNEENGDADENNYDGTNGGSYENNEEVSLGNSDLKVDQSVEPDESLLKELQTDDAPPEVSALTGEAVQGELSQDDLNIPASDNKPANAPPSLQNGQGLDEDVPEVVAVEGGEEGQTAGVVQPLIGEPLPEGTEVGMNVFEGVASEPFRRLMAPGEAPETYVVQHGDTLEDICDQLLDEPGYWPKLWSFNPQIKNPHFIYPGMILYFYPGDDSAPPYLKIEDAQGLLSSEETPPSEIELMDPELVVKPPLVIPEDLFARLPQNETIVVIREDVDEIGGIFFPSVIGLQVPGFIYGSEQTPLGEVLSGAHGRLNSGAGDEIVVAVSASAPTTGSVWTILRPRGEVHADDGGSFVGYRYDFVAHARFTEALGQGKAAATIIDSRLGAREGDILVSYRATKKAIPARANLSTTAQVGARVVGFDNGGQFFGGQGSYVFVSKAIQPGTAVAIYQPISKPLGLHRETDLPDRRRIVGYMQIIDSTDVASVGYAVNGDRPFRIDDFAG